MLNKKTCVLIKKKMLREAQQSTPPPQSTSADAKTSVRPLANTKLEKQEKLSFGLFFDEYKGSAHLVNVWQFYRNVLKTWIISLNLFLIRLFNLLSKLILKNRINHL